MDWFTVVVDVKCLTMFDLNAYKIEKDAFNAKQFIDLNDLEIWSRITEFEDGVFIGLGNLKRLTLRGIQVNKFNSKALEPLITLEHFTMENCINLESAPNFAVDNLFGTIAMPRMKRVKVTKCNLKKTITDSTFSGLTEINELLLMDNEIECIGPRSFDIVFNKLEFLSLAANKLKSLPVSIFEKARGHMVSIKLDENNWHCDCDLEDLRKYMQYSESKDLKEAICMTPTKYAGQKIFKLPSLCFEMPLPEPVQTSIVFPDDEENNNDGENEIPQIDEPGQFALIHCGPINGKKNVKLQQSDKIRLPTIRVNHGKLIICTAHLSKDFYYFGYEQNMKMILMCLGNSRGDKVRKIEIDLHPYRMYRLCRLKRKHNSITPMECIPYFTGSDENNFDVWITEKYKAAFISIIMVIAVIMPFLGILVSVILAKVFPKFIRGKTSLKKQAPSPDPKPLSGMDRFRFV